MRPNKAAVAWAAREESLLTALREKPAMLTLVTHLHKGRAPTLQLLAESGLLADSKKSLLHVLASPPKKLAFKGVLHREPLAYALQHILPRGIAASPAERRLLRHCSEPGEPHADRLRARRRHCARQNCPRRLPRAPRHLQLCSLLALALVKVRSKKTSQRWRRRMVRSSARSFSTALPARCRSSTLVARPPRWSSCARQPASWRPPSRRSSTSRAGPWARAAAPAADSNAHLELAAAVFESRPFLDQLQTVLLSVDLKVEVGVRELKGGAQPKPFVYVLGYTSYNAFPKLPHLSHPPAAGVRAITAGAACRRPPPAAPAAPKPTTTPHAATHARASSTTPSAATANGSAA